MTKPKSEITKCELHPVRLDSDVWDAVVAMRPLSLNKFLRSVLIDGSPVTVEEVAREPTIEKKVKTSGVRINRMKHAPVADLKDSQVGEVRTLPAKYHCRDCGELFREPGWTIRRGQKLSDNGDFYRIDVCPACKSENVESADVIEERR